MKIIAALATLLLLVVPLTVSGQQENDGKDDFAAQVGDQVIGRAALQQILVAQRQAGDVQGVLATLTPEGKEQVLQQMVDSKLFSMEARQQGLAGDVVVQQAIERAVDAVLADFFIKQEIEGLDLSDTALKDFYQVNSTEFRTGRRVHARHIITSSAEGAAAALEQVRQGRDFSQVAGENNIDSSKADAGDLGWVKHGVMVKPFEEALFALDEGEISDVVQTRYGFHIILAEEIDEGNVVPFEAVKKQIKQKIVSMHLAQVKEKLREKYPVVINSRMLVDSQM